jgi:flagellar L-ring protein precursor FlgH
VKRRPGAASVVVCGVALGLAFGLAAGGLGTTKAWATKVSRKETKAKNSLAQYVAREGGALPTAAVTAGSCWVDSGRMASLGSDYKAAAVGDVVTIVVAHNLTSSNAGDVSTARTFSASSGVDSLPGKLKVGGAATLLGLHSAETLAGKGAADSSSSLTTTLAGRVVAVLGNQNLVVEAERVINMNNEKQTITLRGVVRPGDVGPDNTVASDAIGDLELEIKGKGVISEGVRPPHPLLRAILRILNF